MAAINQQDEAQNSAEEIKAREEAMVDKVLAICAEESLTYEQAIKFLGAASQQLQRMAANSPVPGA